MDTRTYTLDTVLPKDCTPHPKNPKKHSKKQLDNIAESMKLFGFTSPIVIDENNVILAGHGRVEAVKSLGHTGFIPCMRVTGFTDEEKQALLVADNKLGEQAEWDDDLLNMVLSDINIDLVSMGLVMDDIEELDEPVIETIDDRKTAYNFIIKCEDADEIMALQNRLGVDKPKMSYAEFNQCTIS